MRQAKGYILHKSHDKYYLLPYGQRVAAHCHGIEINRVGADIWNHISEFKDSDDFISHYISQHSIPASDIDTVRNDLSAFISQLESLGYLISDESACNGGNRADSCSEYVYIDTVNNSSRATNGITTGISEQQSLSSVFNEPLHEVISIAGLGLALYGKPDYFDKSFDDFISAEHETVADIIVTSQKASYSYPYDSLPVIRSADVEIFTYGDNYILSFPTLTSIDSCYISADGTDCVYHLSESPGSNCAEDIFHAIRFAFVYIAKLHERYVFHSASILYRDRAWLFTGPSGTGKSTHTNIWVRLLGVDMLNGDLNILMIKDGSPVAAGLPWCGTSGIYTSSDVRLGGIIILSQSPENDIVYLSDSEQELQLTLRLISPSWSGNMLRSNLDFMSRLVPHIFVCKLKCNMSDEACYTVKSDIDKYLNTCFSGEIS